MTNSFSRIALAWRRAGGNLAAICSYQTGDIFSAGLAIVTNKLFPRHKGYMRLKFFLVTILAIVSCGALQAQNADTAPSPNADGDQGHYHHWRHHHAWIWKKLNLRRQRGQIKSMKRANQKPEPPCFGISCPEGRAEICVKILRRTMNNLSRAIHRYWQLRNPNMPLSEPRS